MSGLPAAINNQLGELLGARPSASRRVSGGDIHSAFRVPLSDGRELFVKTSPDTPPDLFAAEAAGLAWLAGHGARTAEVLGWADKSAAGPGWLALTWLDTSRRKQGGVLGADLARLHSQALTEPGWQRPCFIGPLPQDNRAIAPEGDRSAARPAGGTVQRAGSPDQRADSPGAAWARFWVERRLRPMTRRASDALGRAGVALMEQVCERCPPLVEDLPAIAPLHGDLWGGNVLWAEQGPVLIDPAVYGGDPEVDLAMMALFGGFDAEVWAAYHRVHPRRAGFEERQALYQLWPLLVHVVLFGGGYAAGVMRNARVVLGAVG